MFKSNSRGIESLQISKCTSLEVIRRNQMFWQLQTTFAATGWKLTQVTVLGVDEQFDP